MMPRPMPQTEGIRGATFLCCPVQMVHVKIKYVAAICRKDRQYDLKFRLIICMTIGWLCKDSASHM